MTFAVWLSFLGACVAISLTPGAGAVASMLSGTRYGWRGGIWTALGLQLAILVHLALVAAGLGALMMSVPAAFVALQIAGCVYLAWLGLRLIFTTPRVNRSAGGETREAPWARVWRGFLVNATNPKAIVFLLAVLPPFLDLSRPLAPQYFAMAITMVAVDTVVMAGLYTWAGARLLDLPAGGRGRRWVDAGFGCMFLAAAVLLAVFRR